MKRLFFAQPGLFTSWGLLNGELDPEELPARAKEANIRWICQQVGDQNTEPPPATITKFRAACHKNNLYFGVWEVDPVNLQNLIRMRPNFWVPNVESPRLDYTRVLTAFRRTYPLLPAAVITNDDMDFAPWIRKDVKCIAEAYMNVNANATPWNMCQRSRQQGYTYVFPAFGVYDNTPLELYEPFLPRYQAPTPEHKLNGWSIYLAEGLPPTPATWTTLRRFTT